MAAGIAVVGTVAGHIVVDIAVADIAVPVAARIECIRNRSRWHFVDWYFGFDKDHFVVVGLDMPAGS